MLHIKPRTLFLIDGSGALVTLISLLAIRQWNEFFGMPAHTLVYLAVVAGGFSVYSLSCFLKFSEHWPLFLRAIAVANTCYCLATVTLLILHFEKLTSLGAAYFIGEIIIILALVFVEFKTASQTTPQHSHLNE